MHAWLVLASFLLTPALLLSACQSAHSPAGNSVSATPTMQRLLDEVRNSFTLNGEPITPLALNDLNGRISDNVPIVTTVDILAGNHSNRYSGEVSRRGGRISVSVEAQSGVQSEAYSYRFIGRLDNDLLVVQFDKSGGGSGSFGSILVMDAFVERGKHSGEIYERLCLKIVQEEGLGDRFAGTVAIKGNTLHFSGEDQDTRALGTPRRAARLMIERP